MEKSEKYKARLMEKSEKYKARLLQDARASPVLWGARKRGLLYENAIPYDNLLNLIKKHRFSWIST